MCSISVEPRPSMISTPKRSSHARPTCSGSASPADTHRRKRWLPAFARARRVGEDRSVEGRHAEEDRWLLTVEHGEDRLRRRAFIHEDCARAGGHRECQAIAEPVGEEQLRGGEEDVGFGDAENSFAVGCAVAREAGVDVPHALRHAGRAGGVEPEGHIVGAGVGYVRRGSGRGRFTNADAGCPRLGSMRGARSSTGRR